MECWQILFRHWPRFSLVQFRGLCIGRKPCPSLYSNLCNLFSLGDSTACSTQRQFKASREYTKHEHNPVLSSLCLTVTKIILQHCKIMIPVSCSQRTGMHQSFNLIMDWRAFISFDRFNFRRMTLTFSEHL